MWKLLTSKFGLLFQKISINRNFRNYCFYEKSENLSKYLWPAATPSDPTRVFQWIQAIYGDATTIVWFAASFYSFPCHSPQSNITRKPRSRGGSSCATRPARISFLGPRRRAKPIGFSSSPFSNLLVLMDHQIDTQGSRIKHVSLWTHIFKHVCSR